MEPLCPMQPPVYPTPYNMEPSMDFYVRCPMMDPMIRQCVSMCMRQYMQPMEMNHPGEMLPEEFTQNIPEYPYEPNLIE